MEAAPPPLCIRVMLRLGCKKKTPSNYFCEFFFCEFHFRNLERNYRLHTVDGCTYMWHYVYSFIYHSVSDPYIYIGISELRRRWQRVQGLWSSKKFIIVTGYTVPNPTPVFLAFIRLTMPPPPLSAIRFKLANLMDQRTY